MDITTKTYRESPDFNLLIEHGKEEKLAANMEYSNVLSCVICIMTEFGISNDRRMSASEFSKFIRTTQAVGMVTE
jgi:hypothetical protein